jgi:hypothetical protein
MATTKAKKAAPVKKAAAKKAAPVKKAAAKKTAAKEAAPVRKKAVAKRAVPVRKKAVVKKAVTKKAAPVKKAVATKAATKKAVPVRKKAVAKKAAPTNVKKIELAPVASVSSTDKSWLQPQAELPVFLKDVKSEIKKEPISTQGYSKKKSRKPALVGFGSVVLLLGVVLFTASSQTTTNMNSESQKSNEVSTPKVTTEETVIEEAAPKPETTKSSSEQKPSKANLSSFAPRNFSSTFEGQEISFAWIAPADSSSVIGYELSVKKAGANDWVVISAVTPQQISFSVELVSMDSTSQYRIASILESGKLAFNKAVLTHPGAVD